MENLKSPKSIAAVTTALFVISLLWLVSTERNNSSLETGFENERLKSEEILSEKLLLEKELQKFHGQLLGVQNHNLALSDVVRVTTAKLSDQEADYYRMKKANLSLNQVKKQRQELIALQGQLENELQTLKLSHEELVAKNNELSHTVASLRERNQLLVEDVNKAMFAAVDQSQVQALKGKREKLTVRARKTRKLVANFEVPANLKNLSFRIVDTKGYSMTQKDGVFFSSVSPSDRSYTATSEWGALGSRLQKVEMVFMPKKRLNAGVYTVEILSESLYVGSMKVKLN